MKKLWRTFLFAQKDLFYLLIPSGHLVRAFIVVAFAFNGNKQDLFQTVVNLSSTIVNYNSKVALLENSQFIRLWRPNLQ